LWRGAMLRTLLVAMCLVLGSGDVRAADQTDDKIIPFCCEAKLISKKECIKQSHAIDFFKKNTNGCTISFDREGGRNLRLDKKYRECCYFLPASLIQIENFDLMFKQGIRDIQSMSKEELEELRKLNTVKPNGSEKEIEK
jgi:hypothetical protein